MWFFSKRDTATLVLRLCSDLAEPSETRLYAQLYIFQLSSLWCDHKSLEETFHQWRELMQQDFPLLPGTAAFEATPRTFNGVKNIHKSLEWAHSFFLNAWLQGWSHDFLTWPKRVDMVLKGLRSRMNPVTVVWFLHCYCLLCSVTGGDGSQGQLTSRETLGILGPPMPATKNNNIKSMNK